MRLTTTSLVGMCGAVVTAWSACAQAPGLHVLPSNNNVTEISSSGMFVGGSWSDIGGNSRPFIWTAAGGQELVPVSGIVGIPNVTDLSANGQTLIGSATGTTGERFAYRWQRGATSYENIGRPSVGSPGSFVAGDTNADGSVVLSSVGFSASPDRYVYRWTQASGTWSEVPIAPTSVTDATDLTPDGQVIVGNWDQDGSGVTDTPFLYREGVGRLDLPMVAGLPQPRLHLAAAVNSFGSIVVGSRLQNGSSINHQPVIWHDGVATDLPIVQGATSANATDVSDDGSIVVGGGGLGGFVWTPSTGSVTLRAFLLGYGINFPENVTMQRILVSGDGSAIAGRYSVPGDSSYGFIAYIPSPATSIVFGGILVYVSRRRRR